MYLYIQDTWTRREFVHDISVSYWFVRIYNIIMFVMYAVLVLLESLSITKHAVTHLVTITVAPMFPINVFFNMMWSVKFFYKYIVKYITYLLNKEGVIGVDGD